MDSGFKQIKRNFSLSFFRPENTVTLRDRFDYGPFPIPYYFVYWYGQRAKKYYGAKIGYNLECSQGAYHKGVYRNIFGTKKDWENWFVSIQNKVVAQSKFTRNCFRKSQQTGKRYRQFLNKLLKLNLKNALIDDVISLHKKWMHFYAEYSFWNIPIWFGTSDGIAEYIMNFLRKDYGLKEGEIEILTTSPYPSYVFQEELELLRAAKSLNLASSFNLQSAKAKDLLRRHESRWGWLPFDYIGPMIWQADDFFHRVKNMVAKEKISVILNDKKKYHSELKKQQKSIINQFGLSKEHRRLLSDLHLITLMQDQKKELCTLAQYSLQTVIFRYIGNKLKIKPVHCIKFHHEDLWQALRTNNKFILKELPNRLKAVTCVADSEGMSFISGPVAAKVFHLFDSKHLKIKQLSGQTASGGLVKGRAKILLTPSQLFKVNQGDIIIAPMTTPDFIVAMKKASAIVTDEGGMTSHAAIVSRELKIPCIVGTKIATRVLKDGDMVEVDANKGIVKLVNSK